MAQLQAEREADVAMNQFVTFRLGEETYGIPISHVREIIRPQKITKVPLVSDFVEGITNLRGAMLLVVNGRRMFDMSRLEYNSQTRIIVLVQDGHMLGYVIDQITGVETIREQDISAYGADKHEWIQGVAHSESKKTVMMLLDPREIFSHAHMTTSSANQKEEQSADTDFVASAIDQRFASQQLIERESKKYVRFRVGQEEYGLPISDVQDIVRLPAKIDHLPGSPAYLLGLGLLRNQVQPIIQLSQLLGIASEPLGARTRVVMVEIRHGSQMTVAGLVVDNVSDVLNLASSSVLELPAALKTKRNSYITGVHRNDETKTLMYMLNLQELLPWHSLEQFMLSGSELEDSSHFDEDGNKINTSVTKSATEQLYLLFDLSEEEFGLPIQQVKEILRVPAITQLPHSPHFLAGIANIRSQLITIIDLRQRLGFDATEKATRQRIIIAEVGDQLYGLLVDHIREARKIDSTVIEKVKESAMLRTDTHYLTSIAKLDGERMIMLLNLQAIFNWED